MMRFYDRDGRQIDRIQWTRYFLLPEYRVIARNRVREIEISTVWIGMNQRAERRPPPLIFETAVFGGWPDETIIRYATELDARRGHDHLVDLAKRFTRHPVFVERIVERIRRWA